MTYLHIFSIQLLIQWEALDNTLITGMERTKLYPLVGWISANRANKQYSADIGLLKPLSNTVVFKVDGCLVLCGCVQTADIMY